jgi:hypothetical protein
MQDVFNSQTITNPYYSGKQVQQIYNNNGIDVKLPWEDEDHYLLRRQKQVELCIASGKTQSFCNSQQTVITIDQKQAIKTFVNFITSTVQTKFGINLHIAGIGIDGGIARAPGGWDNSLYTRGSLRNGKENNNLSTGQIAGIVVGTMAGIGTCAIGVYMYRVRQKSKQLM